MYSSSSDVNGPLAFSCEDIFHIFNTIQGEDQNDSNCIDFSQLNESIYRNQQNILDTSLPSSEDESYLSLKGIKVGILEEFLIDEIDQRNQGIQSKVLDLLE